MKLIFIAIGYIFKNSKFFGFLSFEGKAIKNFGSFADSSSTFTSILKKFLPPPAPEPDEELLVSCRDDDGLNFTNQGHVTFIEYHEDEGYENKTLYTDKCSESSRKFLIEYTCEGNQVKTIEHGCEFACNIGEGVCGKESDRGIVYVVHAVDTETVRLLRNVYNQTLQTWNYGNDTYESFHYVANAMNASFRNSKLDSFGDPIKFSWFLMTHEAYCHSIQHDCNIIHTIMEKYSGIAKQYGDVYGWHYHHADWPDYDNDGTFFWNQILTFNGTDYTHGTDIELAEKMLAMQILNHKFYPGVYRFGWTWENNGFSNWLDDIVPFDFSSLAPLSHLKPAAWPDGIYNVYNWSQAPADWSFYHPNSKDYQAPGNLKRIIFRCSITYPGSNWSATFEKAYHGEDAIICLYSHSFSDLTTNFPRQFFYYQDQYRVKFKYVNALEGAKKVLGYEDDQPPVSVLTSKQKDVYEVSFNEPLFSYSFGAVKDSNGKYFRIKPVNLSPQIVNNNYVWTFDLSNISYEEFAVAGSDQSENTFVTEKMVKK